MEMAICNAEPNVESKRKKKQKRRGSAFKGDHTNCDPSEGYASKDDVVPVESPVKMCLNLEPEGRQSHSEVILLREKNENGWKKAHSDLQYGEASGIPVSNVLNVELVKKEDEPSVPPNAELYSADGKENSLVPDESDGRVTSMIKSDDQDTEIIDHLSQPSHVDIQRRKKRKCCPKRGRALESPKRSLVSNTEDGKKVPLPGFPDEGETISHLKDFATVEVMNGVLCEEDSHGSMDGENATMIKKEDDCLKTGDCLAQISSNDTLGLTNRKQKKRRRRRKFADSLNGSLESKVEDDKKVDPFNCLNEVETTSFHEHSTTTERDKNVSLEEVSIDSSIADFPSEINERMHANLSLKILKQEMKNTQNKKQKVSRFLAHGSTNDDVSAVLENNRDSQVSKSSKERDAIGCSKKKLLILDVNGLLVDFVPYFADGYTPDIVISKKAGERKITC